MTSIPTITLNNGVQMPQLGFGVFQIPDDGTTAAVASALAAGYRSIDTAAIYGNEAGTGRALRESGIARANCSSPPRSESKTSATSQRLPLSIRASRGSDWITWIST
jgi:hypothetical protein